VARGLSNVIGFDDGPFDKNGATNVRLVGTVCARTRLDGVVSGFVRRDGANSTERMIELVQTSQFVEHIQAVLLQGIAVGGFNVVDVQALAAALNVPVLVIMRRRPRLESMRAALLNNIPGATRKWSLIEAAGPVEPLGQVFCQRVGLSLREAQALLAATTLHGNLPEALRLAHLIAGGVTTGKSRGRA
jgi:endonuclease V-like protein UPF0215 family